MFLRHLGRVDAPSAVVVVQQQRVDGAIVTIVHEANGPALARRDHRDTVELPGEGDTCILPYAVLVLQDDTRSVWASIWLRCAHCPTLRRRDHRQPRELRLAEVARRGNFLPGGAVEAHNIRRLRHIARWLRDGQA